MVDNRTQVLDPIRVPAAGRSGGFRRVVTLVALVSLLGAAMVLARDAGTPSVDNGTKVVAEMSTPALAEAGAPANLAPAQFFEAIQEFICDLLAAIAAQFPSFIAGFINLIRVFFGCISPA